MKMAIDKEWLEKRAAMEGDSEIGAGATYVPPFIPSDADKFYDKVIAAYDRTLAAKDAVIANMTAALTGKFCVCFMDGINDHGTHVLPSFPRSVDCDFDVLEQAQAIWTAGDIEGFQAGDHIWCEFSFHPAQTGPYGQVENASYWEFTRIDADLSRAINSAALKEQAHA